MRYGYESPQSYGDNFHFGHINMQRYIEAAETADDRKEAVSSLAAVLQRVHAQFLSSATPFLARGVFVTHERDGYYERFEEEAYGILLAIEPIHVLENWYIAAKMELEQGHNRVHSLLLSAETGTEFALVPDYHASYTGTPLLNYWRIIAEASETVEDFLFTASAHLGSTTLSSVGEDNLQALEAVMLEQYDVRKLERVFVTGSNSTLFGDSSEVRSPFVSAQSEAAVVGDFEGLAFREYVNKNGKDCAQLCIALRLPDARILLQPCCGLQSLNSVSA